MPDSSLASRQRIGQESNLQSSRIFRSIGFTNWAPPIQKPSFCVEKDEPTRLRRDGLEPSTLAHEASKLPLLYPAVGVVGLEPDDSSVKSRLLYQLSYTPVMDHDGVEPPTPRASIWRSTVELTIHKPVTRFGLALLVWKTRILPLDDTSKYSSNTTVWDRAATD